VSPEVVVVSDGDELGRLGADLVAGAIHAVPRACVAVATGMSPMGLYRELAVRSDAGAVDARSVSVFQLDEYLGLGDGDPRSLFGWMRSSFLAPLGIADASVTRLPTDGDLDAGCAAFDRDLVDRGGLDLAVLGLGPNGHLGFNEPPSAASAPTRAVELSPATVAANARYWDGAGVPEMAVTMGMAPMLSAKRIVLVVSGPSKRAIVHRMLEGPVDPSIPASYLRTVDGDVTVLVDRAAWGDG
jgi:glucosamine-6-phosphate deaminase